MQISDLFRKEKPTMPQAIQPDLAAFLVRLIDQTPEHDAWSTLMAIKRIAKVNLEMASPPRRAVSAIEKHAPPSPISDGRSKPGRGLAAFARSA